MEPRRICPWLSNVTYVNIRKLCMRTVEYKMSLADDSSMRSVVKFMWLAEVESLFNGAARLLFWVYMEWKGRGGEGKTRKWEVRLSGEFLTL